MSNSSEVRSGNGNLSATEWACWVAERVEARKRTFLNEPEEMIGAYDRERSNMDNYRVYEVEVGHRWKVVELADPLVHEWDVSYDVDLFRCSETKYLGGGSVRT